MLEIGSTHAAQRGQTYGHGTSHNSMSDQETPLLHAQPFHPSIDSD